jgi:predicted enzyme related to lactoylglutathione lyase
MMRKVDLGEGPLSYYSVPVIINQDQSAKEKTNMSSPARFGFVLENVPDIEAARRFYVEVLGLEVERYHPQFIQFSHFAIASDDALTRKPDHDMYWLVDNAEASFKELSQKAEVIQPLETRPFGTLFVIKDPAGLPVYIIEMSQNRPSQAVKSSTEKP